MGTVTLLRRQEPQGSWVEVAPCEHVVQIYGGDRVFLDSLETFVAYGLRRGEATIVIATAMHLHGLEERLRADGLEVEQARAEGRYVPRLAEDLLESCMDGEWPDEARFAAAIDELAAKARAHEGRRARVFAEMAAILWARGNHAATIHLELLWSKACQARKLALFCAYPRDTFSRNATESIVEICRIHSRVAPPLA
jgi:hypothetical protein